MENKNLQGKENKELVSINDIKIVANNDLTWYGNCQIDLNRIRGLGVNMMIIPNLDEEGQISSDFESIAVFELREGMYAIELSDIDGSSIVQLGSDDPEEFVFSFDKEYYTQNANAMISKLGSL